MDEGGYRTNMYCLETKATGKNFKKTKERGKTFSNNG
jgi:hypothetical protein